MSHIPQRLEKDCLNCGTIVEGKYCQNCGQENVVPKETFWHMFTHFFYDITHFDGSFFHTIHHLILKPGFLSKEYMGGRRVSYLHPIRMYVFTSAIFFLLFFNLFKNEKNASLNLDTALTLKERQKTIEDLRAEFEADTSNALFLQGIKLLEDTTRPVTQKEALVFFGTHTPNFIKLGGRDYKTTGEYDSAQNLLPAAQRDGWFVKRMIKKVIVINEKYRDNPGEAFKKFGESVLHKLPYMLFVSLPLFALILKLVYVRRKKYFYADHGVFTIHLYVFTFLLLLLAFGLGELDSLLHSNFIGMVIALLFIGLFIYLFKAMRVFYQQGWGKTFIKFLIVALVSLLMMMILLILFIFFSAFTL